MTNLSYLVFAFIICFVLACSNRTLPKTNLQYDAAIAESSGADAYGMKQYVMAFLKTGPNRPTDKAAAAALQTAHLENIGRLAEAGKLIVAGPFLDDQDIRGIYIFDVRSLDEAEALTATDPAIKAGSLIMELHPWYGPASLMEVIELNKKYTKSSF